MASNPGGRFAVTCHPKAAILLSAICRLQFSLLFGNGLSHERPISALLAVWRATPGEDDSYVYAIPL